MYQNRPWMKENNSMINEQSHLYFDKTNDKGKHKHKKYTYTNIQCRASNLHDSLREFHKFRIFLYCNVHTYLQIVFAMI
jgi:hypothetical protein